ncbi:MAG: translation initiation factor [Phycisphaerales bacterium]
MSGLFDGTPLERAVTCERCEKPLSECRCPRDADGRVLTPNQQRISVRIEKRRGKPVTIASGFDASASDLPAILRSLRTALGAGGSTGTDHNGKPMVEVQGEHAQRVREALKAMGYQIK